MERKSNNGRGRRTQQEVAALTQVVKNGMSFLDKHLHWLKVLVTPGKQQSKASIVSQFTGIPQSTVYRYNNEDKSKYKPNRYEPVTPSATFRKSKVTLAILEGIRNIVIDFYRNGTQLTRSKVYQKYRQEYPDEPIISLHTVGRILNDQGFKYRKTKVNTNLLQEKEYFQKWKALFFLKRRELLNKGCKFYYTYETWHDISDCQTKLWKCKTEPGTQVQQRKTRGSRFILCHIGSSDGFVAGAEKIVYDKDQAFHKTTTESFYEEWISEIASKGLIKPNSVIVMDNASYHSPKKFLTPKPKWTKERIIEFILNFCKPNPSITRAVMQQRQFTKKKLLDYVEKQNIQPPLAVEKFLKKFRITILRLPPYNWQFNPIEFALSGVKKKIRRRSILVQSEENVRSLFDKEIAIESTNWKSYFDHCDKLMDTTFDKTFTDFFSNSDNVNDFREFLQKFPMTSEGN